MIWLIKLQDHEGEEEQSLGENLGKMNVVTGSEGDLVDDKRLINCPYLWTLQGRGTK
jgi:hypothetical protein